MLFRNETWAVKKEDVIRLEKEIRTEGRIFVEELKDRLKLSAIKGYLQNILLWFGHLERMKTTWKKLTNLIVWETHWLSNQFAIERENASKHILWVKPGKLLLILFPYYECFFPIQFPSYGILHHMGNAWVSASISYSTGKCNKTYHWENLGN